ncbi:hypothetical protein ILYODFUR_022042 [Ilyodon furcidens]|uniref:Uncharacterized protein n=1 Tax=Ilyodon furcidens TaxID=33524 RepID=A0ABV0SNB9_9TELE
MNTSRSVFLEKASMFSKSLQASLHQSSAARQQAQGSQEARGSKQASTTEGKVEMQSGNHEEPDVCTLSLAEKMELFNRLAQPPTRVTRTRGDTRQRRANARYQTQPVTLGDMEQLQNAGTLYGHTSSSSVLRAGATVFSDHAGDIHITSATVHTQHTPPNSDRPPLHCHPEVHAVKSQDTLDHHMNQILDQGENTMNLKVGKRRLPSPERAVRQASLPQPHTGRERWWEEEEEEQHWLSRVREEAAIQSLGSHKFWQKEEHRRCPREDSHRIRTISADLPDSTAVTSRDAVGLAISERQPLAGGQSVCLVQLDSEEDMGDVMIDRRMSIRDRASLARSPLPKARDSVPDAADAKASATYILFLALIWGTRMRGGSGTEQDSRVYMRYSHKVVDIVLVVFRLSGTGSRGQQTQQRHPDVPVPRHLLQLHRGEPKAFLGQLRDSPSSVSWAVPWAVPWASSRWDVPGY